MILHGLHPATVKTYDADMRYCTVDLEGLTIGADSFPQAQIAYSLGDKSTDTEIEILAGDLVWVSFQGGDPRYPIIVNYRTKNKNASIGKRRWHHLNIELEADEKAEIIVGESKITAEPDNIALTIGNAMIKAENNKITLSVGGSSYVLEPEKISETSPEVVIDAENVNASGNMNAAGDVVAASESATPISVTTQSHNGNLGAPVSPQIPS